MLVFCDLLTGAVGLPLPGVEIRIVMNNTSGTTIVEGNHRETQVITDEIQTYTSLETYNPKCIVDESEMSIKVELCKLNCVSHMKPHHLTLILSTRCRYVLVWRERRESCWSEGRVSSRNTGTNP